MKQNQNQKTKNKYFERLKVLISENDFNKKIKMSQEIRKFQQNIKEITQKIFNSGNIETLLKELFLFIRGYQFGKYNQLIEDYSIRLLQLILPLQIELKPSDFHRRLSCKHQFRQFFTPQQYFQYSSRIIKIRIGKFCSINNQVIKYTVSQIRYRNFVIGKINTLNQLLYHVQIAMLGAPIGCLFGCIIPLFISTTLCAYKTYQNFKDFVCLTCLSNSQIVQKQALRLAGIFQLLYMQKISVNQFTNKLRFFMTNKCLKYALSPLKQQIQLLLNFRFYQNYEVKFNKQLTEKQAQINNLYIQAKQKKCDILIKRYFQEKNKFIKFSLQNQFYHENDGKTIQFPGILIGNLSWNKIRIFYQTQFDFGQLLSNLDQKHYFQIQDINLLQEAELLSGVFGSKTVKLIVLRFTPICEIAKTSLALLIKSLFPIMMIIKPKVLIIGKIEDLYSKKKFSIYECHRSFNNSFKDFY